jgi:ribonuclease BN (tRNA processing enzyme)
VQLPPQDSKRRERLERTRVEITPPGDEREVMGLTMRSVEVPHVAHLECLARRFEAGGRSVVYSGDTTVAPEIMTPLSEGAEVLIHEAYSERALAAFVATQPESMRERLVEVFAEVHTVLPEAAKIAQAAGVGRLVLTHLLAEEDAASMVAEASAHFRGEVLVAREGLAIDV